MSGLNHISIQVQEKSEVVRKNTKSINSIMGSVSQVSSTVAGAITEVHNGYNEVSSPITGLKTISDRISSISEDIDREVNQFTTLTLYWA